LALQVDKCAAFGRWTECQVKANKAVDGSTANAEPSPTRQSDDTERGEWLAFMVPHRHDDLTSAQLGLGGCRYRKSVRLETKHSHISGGVAARERSVGDAPARKRKLDVLVALQDFFGCDDDSGTPMDAARGPPPSAINGDDAAGDAFDKLRGVVRECKKGAIGFDHDHFSKEKLPGRDMTSTPIPFYWPNGWSRTSREQPGTSPELQWLGGTHNRWTKTANGSDLGTFPLTRCSHFVLMTQ
jgi:hypothetical protein